MNTQHLNEDRLLELTRSNARWRLLAVSSVALVVGVVIGGMGNSQPAQSGQHGVADPAMDPTAVVDRVGMADRIVQFHADGNMTYLKMPDGERTGNGYYNWGKVKIDPRYTSRTLPQP